jgi:hypothetical protein
VRPKKTIAWIFVWALLATSSSLAHDPYEIASTARLEANSLELQIEMEFRTALRLAGMGDELQSQTAEDLFRLSRSKLMDVAGAFFQITAGGNLISAETTNVTMGVESHIQFSLKYPPTDSGPCALRQQV